jgi:hypothetical protein
MRRSIGISGFCQLKTYHEMWGAVRMTAMKVHCEIRSYEKSVNLFGISSASPGTISPDSVRLINPAKYRLASSIFFSLLFAMIAS